MNSLSSAPKRSMRTRWLEVIFWGLLVIVGAATLPDYGMGWD